MNKHTSLSIGVGVGGVVVAWVLALVLHDSPLTALELVLLASGTSLAVSLIGLAFIVALRRRSFTVLLWIGVVSTTLGIAGGVALAGKAMFLSAMDARAVIVMLVAAGTVGGVSALLLGSKLGSAIGEVALKAGAQSLGGGVEGVRTDRTPTRELIALVEYLDGVFVSLQASQDRERAIDTSRRELVAWISHDLRTPLAGIRAMTEAIEDGVVEDAVTISKYHRSILVEVQRLTSMVDDLFRLSQIHAGLVRLNLEPVHLSDLVSDALSFASPVAQASGVVLTGDVSNFDRVVDVSTGEFLRVMRNLLDNAISHTPDGGHVTVATDTNGKEAIVAVRDSCGGIPISDLPRVFELGFRGDIARSPVGTSHAGLGLAIAKGLVDAHGGTIDVANRNEGCCFTIKLPLRQSEVGPLADSLSG
jgi:signal transduction histidine kinase